MKKGFTIALTGMLIAGLITVGPAATAKDGDVRRSGSCSGTSDWELKLSWENGKIEVEFEIDQNKVGDEWRVTLKHDGERFFRGMRETKGPSGSFSDFGRVKVGQDELFVMGDNRANSDDSRSFGPIPEDSVVGEAFVLIWPPSDFGGV